MTARPTKLERTEDKGLLIHWSDGVTRRYGLQELRDACPCATCREKRNEPPKDPMSLNVLSPAEAQPLDLAGMKPVGNYAYGLSFSDGHDTGIFTLELLSSLGKEVEA